MSSSLLVRIGIFVGVHAGMLTGMMMVFFAGG